MLCDHIRDKLKRSMNDLCYSELIKRSTFVERFRYLKLNGVVAHATFGGSRWVNQEFYTSFAWKDIREEVIRRDRGCDLGVEGYDIFDKLLVHHMRPITPSDILKRRDWILDPEYLITTTTKTHNAIHYGQDLGPALSIERAPGDTTLW